MTSSSDTSTSLYAKYAASAAQNYEDHFVPAIGTPFARRLLATARLAPGERVLDVACGTGLVARLAPELVTPQGTVAGLDPTPGMLELARAISPERIDWYEAPAEAMPSVFSVHEPAQADELFSAAGFDEVEVETGTIGLRVDLPADSFWQYVRSTPLAAVVAGLADSARAAFERDVVERCQPFVDGDATVMEPGVLVVIGSRTGRRRSDGR